MVWFIFGAVAYDTPAAGVGAGVALFAVLALTVVRMVPVALALVGTGLPEVLFLGWIAPRGLATIVFGLFAIEAMTEPPLPTWWFRSWW